MRLTYDPGKPQGVITEAGGSALNTHRPSAVLPKSGDARPFLKFLEYMFPDEADRKEVMKWLATLIAHPERRMLYGLLFISETQGVGKSTIGRILAEIVGPHNASFPSERDIGAEFNEWLYEKRLAVVNEVYAGASWKAYHALKDIVTEPFVELNRKFQRKIKVPNWIHLIACSNSFRALKIARGDRRWFVPRVTEEGWPRDKFAELWKWLRRDGFGEIVTWARGYGSYVEDGAHAPMSETKLRVIEEGLSDAGKIAVDLAEKVAAADRAVAVSARKVKEHIRTALAFDRLNESDHELFGLMRDAGVTTWDRIKIGPHRETILVNALALAELEAMPEADRNAAVRDLVAKGLPL